MYKRVRVRGMRGPLFSTLIRAISSIEREADACACILDARGRQKCVALWNVRVPKRLLAHASSDGSDCRGPGHVMACVHILLSSY